MLNVYMRLGNETRVDIVLFTPLTAIAEYVRRICVIHA